MKPGIRAARVAVSSGSAPLLAGLATVTLWGSAFVGIRAAGATFSPGALTLGRLVVSSLALTAIVLVRRWVSHNRSARPSRRDLALIACYGLLFLGAYSITLNTAERFVDAGTAAMIINAGPLLIALLAGFLLHEGFPRGLFVGCAVALAGTTLIGLATTRSATHASLGAALCILAALAYAVAVVAQKAVLARVAALRVTWLGCVLATIACLPFAPTLIDELATASAGAAAWLVYLGLGPTALGFITWNFTLRHTSAGRSGSLNYLIPVVATGLGWIVLGETPPLLAIAGGAICLAGVYLARRPRLEDRPAHLGEVA